MNRSTRQKILILSSSRLLSMQDRNLVRYRHMAERFDGLVVQTTPFPELQRTNVDGLQFHAMVARRTGFASKGLLLQLRLFHFAIRAARTWQRHFGSIDFVVTHDPFASGLVGWALARLLGARLVVEINGNYGSKRSWILGSRTKTVAYLKYLYCQLVIPFVANRSFGVKLLYPQQLVDFRLGIRNDNIGVFHDFVPVSSLGPSGQIEPYILFLGKPWHVKGVDVLIKAFLSIQSDYRGKLRIVGYFPPAVREMLLGLARGSDQVSIESAVDYDEAQVLIDRCELLVLPSRTEAMGRVLLEAMAHGKAIVGSTADGIPSYLVNRANGLLFESEDWMALAKAMRELVLDESLRRKLGDSGYAMVNSVLSEAAYLDYYESLLSGAGTSINIASFFRVTPNLSTGQDEHHVARSQFVCTP